MVTRVAMAGLVIVFLTGSWLVAAPFVLRFQHSGAPWTSAARVDIAVGAMLAVASSAGFFIALGGRVRELYAEAAPDRG